MIGLLVGALTAATVMTGASVAFVMVRRRRMIRQVSRRSRSASFQDCAADKPQLPPAIHLTVSPLTHSVASTNEIRIISADEDNIETRRKKIWYLPPRVSSLDRVFHRVIRKNTKNINIREIQWTDSPEKIPSIATD